MIVRLLSLWVLVFLLVVSAASADDAVFLVTNVNDSDEGSLRQAILDANAASGRDTIHFEIAGDGPHTIQLQSPLPAITDPVVIDGTTQPGASCDGSTSALMVELDGSLAGERTDGIVLATRDSVIRGLVVNRFDRDGLRINAPLGNNHIACNFIGTDVTGTTALANGRSGVHIDNSAGNRIGGLSILDRNLVSGNKWDGIVLFGEASVDNVVQGNYVGTDITGTVALANRNVGVFIDRAPLNMIGGTQEGARNLISGNGWEGIYINESSAHSNVVIGNYIGTNITGTVALGNTDSGIVISRASNNVIGGTTSQERNIIAANGLQGVYITGTNAQRNTVIGNYIGTDVTGQVVLGNGGSGVYLNSALRNTVDGNLIAGNQEYGYLCLW